jgi:CheY-like chemotaxis protein
MTRRGFCPHCRSVQPLGEYQDEGQSGLWCATCRNPIEGSYLERPAARPRPATILCIDDDRIVLSFCSDALERQGFRTLVANDGPAGIDSAKRERPDLILLDVMMPGMNGLETCRLLRAEPTIRDTPIILLTASDDPDLGAKGREVGATVTIRKPFGSSNIIGAVEQALGRKIGPLQR